MEHRLIGKFIRSIIGEKKKNKKSWAKNKKRGLRQKGKRLYCQISEVDNEKE